MTAVASHIALTPEEFLQMEDSIAFELVNGDALERNVSRESCLVAAEILAMLQSANKVAGRLVEVYTSELSYRCFKDDPDMLRRGDVSVVSKSRLGKAGKRMGTMDIPADLVIEVVSPRDAASDVSLKVKLYLENGFRVVWVVDPASRTVSIHTSDAPGRILREQDEIDVGELIPGFRCLVGEFFAGL